MLKTNFHFKSAFFSHFPIYEEMNSFPPPPRDASKIVSQIELVALNLMPIIQLGKHTHLFIDKHQNCGALWTQVYTQLSYYMAKIIITCDAF